MAVASAGPHASLHLAPDRQPRQHPTTRFLQAGCPSCRPTNSVKALKALSTHGYIHRYPYPRQTRTLQPLQLIIICILAANSDGDDAGRANNYSSLHEFTLLQHTMHSTVYVMPVTIDLRRTSNLQNILRKAQGFS